MDRVPDRWEIGIRILALFTASLAVFFRVLVLMTQRMRTRICVLFV